MKNLVRKVIFVLVRIQVCLNVHDDDSAGEPECLQKDDDDQYDETSGVNDGFRNPDGDMDCGNDGDGEFPNVIVDADGEHDNKQQVTYIQLMQIEFFIMKLRMCTV